MSSLSVYHVCHTHTYVHTLSLALTRILHNTHWTYCTSHALTAGKVDRGRLVQGWLRDRAVSQQETVPSSPGQVALALQQLTEVGSTLAWNGECKSCVSFHNCLMAPFMHCSHMHLILPIPICICLAFRISIVVLAFHCSHGCEDISSSCLPYLLVHSYTCKGGVQL